MTDESDQLSAIKAEYDNERREKCLLQVKVEEFENEKKLIAYEKERWAREKEILVQSKQWCMREISNRETRINEMRIEIMKLEVNINREKLAMTEERDALTVKVVELSESVARKDQELTDLRDRVQQIVEARGVTLNEMDAELRTKERLTGLYKTSLEAANIEIEELKENKLRLLNAVQEHEMSIVNLNAQLNKLRDDHMKEMAERNATVKSLNDELTKANELLRTGFRAHRSDDEIAMMSPSAAAVSSLMRSGVSLTSLYTEHCRVVAELEKKTAENEQIERYVTQLVQELKERAPQLVEQKGAYNNALEEIRRLSLQYDLLSAEWNKVQNDRDALVGELNFAKTELRRYEHEHQALSMQIRRLLFVIERGVGSTHEPLDAETEERLFTNICELQQTNIELIRKVRKLDQANAEAIRSTQNSENEALRVALQSAEKELERLREAFAKSETFVCELSAQRGSAAEAGNALPSGVDKTMLPADVQHWKSRADLLQEKLDIFASDKQEADRNYNERIDQQMEQIFQLRTTNGKLESALEYQKKNQQLMGKNIDQLKNELKSVTDEAAKLTVRFETLQVRNDDLTNQTHTLQQELAQVRVINHMLEEQLQVSRSDEHRANDELSMLRNTSFNAERVALMLQEVETILKRTDTKQQLTVINELQTELESMKEQLTDKKMEITQLKQKLQAAIDENEKKTTELDELTNAYEKNQHLLNKMRTIARQYRESNNLYEAEKLQLQLEQIKGEYAAVIAAGDSKPTEASTSWKSHNDGKTEEEIADLQKLQSKLDEAERAKTELAERVAFLETELSEAKEKNMRLDMITSSLNSQREKTKRLTKALKEKDELIGLLQQTVSVSNVNMSTPLVPQLAVEPAAEQSTFDAAEQALFGVQKLAAQPVAVQSPSRKRQYNGRESRTLTVGQEFVDKRSRVADSDPPLNFDSSATVAKIPVVADLTESSGPVTNYGDEILQAAMLEIVDDEIENENKQEKVEEDAEIVNKDAEIMNEDAEIVHEDAEIVHEDAEIVHEDAEIVHEDVEIVHEDVEIVSEDADTVEEDQEIVHEDAEIVSEDIEIVSEDADIVEEDQEIVHEDAEIVSEDIEIVSEDADIVEEDQEIVREDAEIVSEDADIVEEDEEIVHEDAEIVHEDAEIVSEDADIVDEDAEIVHEDAEIVSEELEVESKENGTSKLIEVEEEEDEDEHTIDEDEF